MLMCWLNLKGDIMSNIISSKKLEANRRNALKSTGPKTKEGKLYKKKRRELKGAKKLLHVRKDIFIFVIHMSQLIKIGLGIQK